MSAIISCACNAGASRAAASRRRRRPGRSPTDRRRAGFGSDGGGAQVVSSAKVTADHRAATVERRHRSNVFSGRVPTTRRCRSARRPCGRRRHRNRPRVPADQPTVRRPLRAIEHHLGADRLGRRDHRARTSSSAPVTLETERARSIRAASAGRRPRDRCARRASPGVTSISTRCGRAGCQGTMLEWCSSSTGTMRSPGFSSAP